MLTKKNINEGDQKGPKMSFSIEFGSPQNLYFLNFFSVLLYTIVYGFHKKYKLTHEKNIIQKDLKVHNYFGSQW